MHESLQSRRRGTFLGLAVGDALGAAVEFSRPGTFEPVADFRGGGPHGLGPGEWTDDTSMALALADSIGQVGWDLGDQMRRYLQWKDQGRYSVTGECFDIGTTVSQAMQRFSRTGDARSSGSTDERASGNGSIMRIAPLPMRFSHLLATDLEQLLKLAAESSLPTHGSPQCLSACRYLTLVLCGLIQGEPREAVLAPEWPPLEQLRRCFPLHREIEEVVHGSYRHKNPPDIAGTGYVVKSLEAALWAFHDVSNYSEAVLRAVNLGDDADTTGAVCGQLAGACWGEGGIPQRWREGLAGRDMIEPVLEKLLAE